MHTGGSGLAAASLAQGLSRQHLAQGPSGDPERVRVSLDQPGRPAVAQGRESRANVFDGHLAPLSSLASLFGSH